MRLLPALTLASSLLLACTENIVEPPLPASLVLTVRTARVESDFPPPASIEFTQTSTTGFPVATFDGFSAYAVSENGYIAGVNFSSRAVMLTGGGILELPQIYSATHARGANSDGQVTGRS